MKYLQVGIIMGVKTHNNDIETAQMLQLETIGKFVETAIPDSTVYKFVCFEHLSYVETLTTDGFMDVRDLELLDVVFCLNSEIYNDLEPIARKHDAKKPVINLGIDSFLKDPEIIIKITAMFLQKFITKNKKDNKDLDSFEYLNYFCQTAADKFNKNFQVKDQGQKFRSYQRLIPYILTVLEFPLFRDEIIRGYEEENSYRNSFIKQEINVLKKI